MTPPTPPSTGAWYRRPRCVAWVLARNTSVATAAPPPPSQQEWKQAIIDEAQRYCDFYPTDPICHFKDQPAQ